MILKIFAIEVTMKHLSKLKVRLSYENENTYHINYITNSRTLSNICNHTTIHRIKSNTTHHQSDVFKSIVTELGQSCNMDTEFHSYMFIAKEDNDEIYEITYSLMKKRSTIETRHVLLGVIGLSFIVSMYVLRDKFN